MLTKKKRRKVKMERKVEAIPKKMKKKEKVIKKEKD